MKLHFDDIHEHTEDGVAGAVFSIDERYRYLLYRRWNLLFAAESPRMAAFIGLNPSVADASRNDPTITRCINFAKSWGYDGMYMLNGRAFIATKPADMKRADDPIGPHNADYLTRYTDLAKITVCCWGANIKGVSKEFMRELWGNIAGPTHCLGLSQAGHPLHPLMLKATTEPQPYNPSFD